MLVGLDHLAQCRPLLKRLRGSRVGLLSHAASIDRGLDHIDEVLRRLEVVPRIRFAPEHGYLADAQDMASIDDDQDASSGTRIVSLYGEELNDLIPKAADIRDLDCIVIDLCDVGSRYYTFVWTALLTVRAAVEHGVHCVVLDRPNPIDGVTTEGQFQLPGFHSFVGWERVPIRHGLSVAEMICLFADCPLGPTGGLSVVPVTDWQRGSLASEWDRPFVLPSPNMPTPDTALVYPGGCLIEGTNLSEGRGHTRPFEFVGAPFIDGERLARALNGEAMQRAGLRGFRARPTGFLPTFHKHGQQPCGGVQIHVTDAGRFRPVATYVALIAFAYQQAPEGFAFRTERYEFVDDIPAFDLLTGSAAAREAIQAGEAAVDVALAVSKVDGEWSQQHAHAQECCSQAAWALDADS